MNKMHQRDAVSLNYHVLAPCNMVCKGCFAHLRPFRKARISPTSTLGVLAHIDRLTQPYRTRKITFSGGEPTLLWYLPLLIREAKELGFTTCVVTNGSKLTRVWLRSVRDSLDWIGLSVDSLSAETNTRLGRTVGGRAFSSDEYSYIVSLIRDAGYRLKINTVVSAHNFNEDFNDWIAATKPDRWKVMQALLLEGENDEVDGFFVSVSDFIRFVHRHEAAHLIAETAEDMVGSYAMIGPLGTVIDNTIGRVVHGMRIQEMSQIDFDLWYRPIHNKLIQRGGVYDWAAHSTFPNQHDGASTDRVIQILAGSQTFSPQVAVSPRPVPSSAV